MGTNYLGEAQILYISNSVLESVLTYSNNMLPTVIVFDEFDAAAVMSLNADGYKIDRIVYKPSQCFRAGSNYQKRTNSGNNRKINEYNRNSFKKGWGIIIKINLISQ